MTTSPLTPARAARRQLLLDRIAEYLTDHGAQADNATSYARDLLALVDDHGFTLPTAIDDPPPLRPGRDADPDHRKACKAEIDAAIARARLTARTT